MAKVFRGVGEQASSGTTKHVSYKVVQYLYCVGRTSFVSKHAFSTNFLPGLFSFEVFRAICTCFLSTQSFYDFKRLCFSYSSILEFDRRHTIKQSHCHMFSQLQWNWTKHRVLL